MHSKYDVLSFHAAALNWSVVKHQKHPTLGETKYQIGPNPRAFASKADSGASNARELHARGGCFVRLFFAQEIPDTLCLGLLHEEITEGGL